MRETLGQKRTRLMGPNVPTFYDDPVHIIKGQGVWLWDADGNRYLDCYNNVPHVGHCHPKVVAAIAQQASTLNTHTRYLHDGVLKYIEALTGRLDHDLSQAIMVCSGSEANDIALRMAQAVTGKRGFIATDNTYHGNTMAVSQLSSRRPPIGGYPGHIRLIPAPELLRPLADTPEEFGAAFARHLSRAIVELEESGFGFAGFMLDPIFANEGMPTLPEGFLEPAIGVVRRAGGLIMCDEVQPGFGRLGSHFWGHELMGFAPDVVTVGKPMANGHPVAAVIARPDIMEAFRDAFGYFSTFGGNPVSAAAASAVLNVIEEEDLVANARETGAYFLEKLERLAHPLIAEVRGRGLFLAVEFAKDGTACPDFCHRVVEELRQNNILAGKIGRENHILKLRPPMPIGTKEVDFAVMAIERVLERLGDG